MQYVIDSNVAVKWFLPEPHSEKAFALLEDFRHQGLGLVAPDLLVPEVGHVLWKRSVLTREVPLSEAEESYNDLLSLQIPLQSSSQIAEHAFNLASQERHAIYDAFYIALALERGCELITADQTLIDKLSGKFPLIRPLSTL